MIIRAETLKAVLPAVSNDDTRYLLDGVHVRPDGTIEATNGSVAIQAKEHTPMPDEDFPLIPGVESFHGNPEGNTLISTAIVTSVLSAIAKRSTIPILQCVQLAKNGTDGTATLAATDLQAPRVAKIGPTEQPFPAIDRVMPKADKPDTVDVLFAVDVLETICKAARAASGTGKAKKAPIVRFSVPYDESERKAGYVSSAVRVTYNGPEVGLTIAAMPCRG
jgi:hypothetical protein